MGWHVLTPDAGSDIAAELQLALDTYGHVWITPGNYDCSVVYLPDGARLTGPGAVLKRIQNRVLDIEQRTDVRVFDIGIDLDVDVNHVTGITCKNSTRVTLGPHLHLFTSQKPVDAWTPLGIYSGGAKDVLIHGNHLNQCQIKGNGNSQRLTIRDNFSENAHNFGISVVTTGPTDVTEDVTISGNHIWGPYAGGIYTGSDGDDNTGGQIRGLSITDNHVFADAASYPNWLGIHARAGTQGAEWCIANNMVRAGGLGFAMRVKRIDTAGDARRLVVAGNQLFDSDQADLDITIGSGSVCVTGNVCEGGRGIKMRIDGGHVFGSVTGNTAKHRNPAQPSWLLTEANGGSSALGMAGNSWQAQP